MDTAPPKSSSSARTNDLLASLIGEESAVPPSMMMDPEDTATNTITNAATNAAAGTEILAASTSFDDDNDEEEDTLFANSARRQLMERSTNLFHSTVSSNSNTEDHPVVDLFDGIDIVPDAVQEDVNAVSKQTGAGAGAGAVQDLDPLANAMQDQLHFSQNKDITNHLHPNPNGYHLGHNDSNHNNNNHNHRSDLNGHGIRRDEDVVEDMPFADVHDHSPTAVAAASNVSYRDHSQLTSMTSTAAVSFNNHNNSHATIVHPHPSTAVTTTTHVTTSIHHQDISQQQQSYNQMQYLNTPNNAAMAATPTTAGIYPLSNHQNENSNDNLTQIYATIELPPPQPPKFTNVSVCNPMLIYTQDLHLFSGNKSYWSFHVVSTCSDTGMQHSVRRRFRHFVALEDRLKHCDSCCGSILPPRPHKHTFEEGGGHVITGGGIQSEEFVARRTKELNKYVQLLAAHPRAGHAEEFVLFLTLQDDIGTAWPDVSVNALTRLTEGTQNFFSSVVEQVQQHRDPNRSAMASNSLPEASSYSANTNLQEEDAALLSLTCQESLRIGAVCQSVPRLEGATVLLKEHAEKTGDVGMELNRIVQMTNKSMSSFSMKSDSVQQDLEGFSSAMIKSGRRSKKMYLDTANALQSYVHQLEICPNIRHAFMARKTTIVRRLEVRQAADAKARELVGIQQQIQLANSSMQGAVPGSPYFNDPNAHNKMQLLQMDQERLEMEASMSDEQASQSAEHAKEVAAILKQEVARLAKIRKEEWILSMKSLAVSMRDSARDIKLVWEKSSSDIISK